MRALVTGSSGFIGQHLAERLVHEGYEVWGLDRVTGGEHTNVQGDLRNWNFVQAALRNYKFDETYHLAAEMGGAGYIFTGAHDADVMLHSGQMNLNIARMAREGRTGKLFFSSSACVYPEYPSSTGWEDHDAWASLEEKFAYPAQPDSDYGWEKLFAERVFAAAHRNYGCEVRIARLHNIFGPLGAWNNGREKAPAAICRKVAQAQDGGEIEIWGDGQQQRSFLYIDECVEGICRLMRSSFTGPVNIGSAEMITIDELVDIVAGIAGKKIIKRYVPGPTGVRGRNSNNRLIFEKLGWVPRECLREGLEKTYRWIEQQLKEKTS